MSGAFPAGSPRLPVLKTGVLRELTGGGPRARLGRARPSPPQQLCPVPEPINSVDRWTDGTEECAFLLQFSADGVLGLCFQGLPPSERRLTSKQLVIQAEVKSENALAASRLQKEGHENLVPVTGEDLLQCQAPFPR